MTGETTRIDKDKAKEQGYRQITDPIKETSTGMLETFRAQFASAGDTIEVYHPAMGGVGWISFWRPKSNTKYRENDAHKLDPFETRQVNRAWQSGRRGV